MSDDLQSAIARLRELAETMRAQGRVALVEGGFTADDAELILSMLEGAVVIPRHELRVAR